VHEKDTASSVLCTSDAGHMFPNELWFGTTFLSNGTEHAGQANELIKIQLQFPAFRNNKQSFRILSVNLGFIHHTRSPELSGSPEYLLSHCNTDTLLLTEHSCNSYSSLLHSSLSSPTYPSCSPSSTILSIHLQQISCTLNIRLVSASNYIS
jgi:hypothetical protein